MCRILYLERKEKSEVIPVLKAFAKMAQNSREYQGHGWGCAWWDENHWDFHWDLRPIWKSSFEAIPPTRRLLVHARSAFRDQGIAIENNMPFVRQNLVFIFNGELHGVRLKETGRIGAEKIFNFVLRFYRGNLLGAIQKTIPIIIKKSRYVRAMNLILASSAETVLVSQFSEQPDYFTMHELRTSEQVIVCSEPLNLFDSWQPIANQTVKEIRL